MHAPKKYSIKRTAPCLLRSAAYKSALEKDLAEAGKSLTESKNKAVEALAGDDAQIPQAFSVSQHMQFNCHLLHIFKNMDWSNKNCWAYCFFNKLRLWKMSWKPSRRSLTRWGAMWSLRLLANPRLRNKHLRMGTPQPDDIVSIFVFGNLSVWLWSVLRIGPIPKQLSVRICHKTILLTCLEFRLLGLVAFGGATHFTTKPC